MEPLQQRLGNAPRALDLVGRSSDLHPELAGAGDRVWMSMRHLCLAGPLRPTARTLSRGGHSANWFKTAERTLATPEGGLAYRPS